MCEANVYINRGGQQELFMEKVDRIIPGEDGTIFLESIFGERRVIKASIREMELVHHRIILDEIKENPMAINNLEIWLEPDTDHGHFHEGEKVSATLYKGYNMHPSDLDCSDIQVFLVKEGQSYPVVLHKDQGKAKIVLDSDADGLVQLCAVDKKANLYAKMLIEVGHHHHHALEPAQLPLEIIPLDYSHARLGEAYEVQVLKNAEPLAGAEVKATYAGTHSQDYPHRLTASTEGKASLFLTARGNYLFSVTDSDITSTFTLVKSF